MPDLRLACTVALFAASAALCPPTAAAGREFVTWFVRPASLPFAWQALNEAIESGDAREAFARGQQIMRLVPSWTDGHCAFAFRFALTDDERGDAAARATAAETRLMTALAWLDQARAHARSRELELLQMQSYLPEVACYQFPGLAERLQSQGGQAAITDRYLDEAERRFPLASVREQRIFYTPKLAGALLDNGDRNQALAVLDAAIARVPEVRDRELATEWGERLREVTRWLRGNRDVDLTAVLADPRLQPLWPHLR